MSGDAVNLVADDLHISYRAYLDSRAGLRDRLRGAGQSRLRRRYQTIHAVRGVSFELAHGDALGIIGHNGAGKSTLLLGLSGSLDLDQGSVSATDRPTLLAVGAVLNPALSGRRNLETGCLAIGMTTAEVDDRIEELIEFTGLREFIDLPLKTYSSGMRARIVFTIATVIRPRILMIDEALAVGDKDFRARATERIDELRAEAGSLVLVSHSLSEVRRMCNRVIWMDHGRVVRSGPTDEIVAEYEAAEVGLDGPEVTN